MGKQLKFNFNPFKEGLNHVLGTLEKDIMEVLWKHGESSVKDILDTLPAGRNISYSAVITVTNRMTKKALLQKRKVGKAYFYTPIYDREKFFEIISKKSRGRNFGIFSSVSNGAFCGLYVANGSRKN